MTEKLICDVCEKNEALGVAASPLGPISFAYCSECLKQKVEPWPIVVATVWGCGGYDKLAVWAKEYIDNSIAFHGKTRADLDREVTDNDESCHKYLNPEL